MKKDNRRTLLIIFGAILFAFLINYIVRFSSDLIKQSQIDNARKEAKQKATEYLYDKYNKNFNLELTSEDFKSNDYDFDATFFECGHNENIREYVFKVSLDNLPTNSYITVWKDLTTNQFEVKEVNGEKNNRTDTSYEFENKLYNQKNDIKNDLEKILMDNYGDYKIDYDYDDNKVKVTFNHSFINELNNDLKNINSLIELLKDKDITIMIAFTDFTREYSRNTKIDEERKVCSLVNQVKLYLDENYRYDYSFDLSSAFTIKFSVKIKEKYYSNDKDLYIKLFDYLYNLATTNNEYIILDFIDEEVRLYKYSSYDSLEKYIIKYWK